MTTLLRHDQPCRCGCEFADLPIASPRTVHAQNNDAAPHGLAVEHAQLPRRTDPPCSELAWVTRISRTSAAPDETRINALNMLWRNAKQVSRPADSLAGGRRYAEEHEAHARRRFPHLVLPSKGALNKRPTPARRRGCRNPSFGPKGGVTGIGLTEAVEIIFLEANFSLSAGRFSSGPNCRAPNHTSFRSITFSYEGETSSVSTGARSQPPKLH